MIDRAGRSRLHYLVIEESPETVAAAIEEGDEVNALDENQFAPLHIVCQFYRPEIVLLLLEAGADPNLRNRFGATALHIAVFQRRRGLEVIEALIDFGADPQAENESGVTPQYLVRGPQDEATRDIFARGSSRSR